jgi:hypothetical protein
MLAYPSLSVSLRAPTLPMGSINQVVGCSGLASAAVGSPGSTRVGSGR